MEGVGSVAKGGFPAKGAVAWGCTAKFETSSGNCSLEANRSRKQGEREKKGR